jgi:hypothetical protein
MLLLTSIALATQVAPENLPCPLDASDSVRVYHRASSNTHGGWDSDLANYSSQGQWREYAIGTCRDTLFTLYGEDMREQLTEEQKVLVRQRLAEIRPMLPEDPDELQTWDRYLIAVEMYRVLGRDSGFLYQLYLEASWVARDVAVGEYMGLEGPVKARELLDAGALELKKDLDPHVRKIVLHNLARVAHRGGFLAERDDYLAQFQAVGQLTAEERQKLDEFRFIVDQVEPRIQDLALTEIYLYLSSESAKSDDVQRARATYVMGDLLRRRGRPEEAQKAFRLVLDNESAPQELRDLAWYLGEQLNASK